MLQQDVLVRDDLAITPWTHLEYAGQADREEILRVLDRAARDDAFIAQLTQQGSEALQEYELTSAAKAALLSGDIEWIEGCVGTLGARRRTWLDCRLQQEIW